MGAAIALRLADHPRHQGLITALVLDSPVLNWTVIMTNCARSGIRAAAGHFAIPWLTIHPLAAFPAYSDPSTGPHEPRPTTPVHILHGTSHDSVPIRLSQALRDTRPDLAELETFDADHMLCWNSDPVRWHVKVTTWLAALMH